ncbi:MAG: ATP phosphoribosyltransferase [Clostridiales bacterium]|nr:ATP phosphoribosyltransferase [Clostridiales bacterium]
MKKLTIALSKGRLAKETLLLLKSCNVDISYVDLKSRKLIFNNDDDTLCIILVKPTDVPTYVERGVADIGVVGKDTLMEHGSNVYEMLDLGLGKCKLSIAGYKKICLEKNSDNNLRIATKYPNIIKEVYDIRGQHVDIIKLNGSVELGPLVGLTDVIFDIVESGSTLKENGLCVLEDICDISARLIVNKVSLKVKRDTIVPLIDTMKNVLEQKND